MEQKKTVINNEKGMVLVLAIYMMALLCMIGVAAKMTSTTEIDIAGNDKANRGAFYQTESALAIGAELVDLLGGFDDAGGYVDPDDFLDNSTVPIKVEDLAFLLEPMDVPPGSKYWNREIQADCVCPDIDNDLACDDGRDCGPSHDLEVSTDFVAKIDVDKVDVAHLFGGGAEFAAGAEGTGVSSVRIIYNVDAVGNLPQNASIHAEHVLGFQFIPRN